MARSKRPSRAQTEKIALLALPHLIAVAQKGRTITYGELAAPIHWSARNLGNPLRYIRDEICRPRGLPLLTPIVVRSFKNPDKRLPGKDFLPEGTDDLSPEAYREAFEHHRDAAFDYAAWDDLLRELGLEAVTES